MIRTELAKLIAAALVILFGMSTTFLSGCVPMKPQCGMLGPDHELLDCSDNMRAAALDQSITEKIR